MSTDEGYIPFTGGSAEEAEDFIIAVKRRAYSKGKHKDDAWIADFVSLCLEKKALRWYESLDEETQNDWKLLKRAILEEYKEVPLPPSIIPGSAPTLKSSIQRSIPAAVSLSRIRIGRIRVQCDPNDLKGYISNSYAVDGSCVFSSNPTTAATFEFDVLARTIKFKDYTGHYITAGFRWGHSGFAKPADNYRVLQRDYGVVDDNESCYYIIRVDIWSMGDENELAGRLQLVTGASYELKVFANKESRIYLAMDLPQSATPSLLDRFKPATLYFEPLP